MKNQLCKLLLIMVVVVIGAYSSEPQKNITKCNQIAPVKYATLPIDRNNKGKSVPGDFEPYFGASAMDIDSNGNIYIVNMDNTIQKYGKDGKRVWSTEHGTQQFDIKVYNKNLFSFDGKNVLIHDIDSGKIDDTIPIQIDKKDYTPIGNVSKFYGKYLFISKWFITKDKEIVYVFDLEKKQISPRAPEGLNFYPISKCQACSLSFVESIFKSKEEFFVNESDEYIAYFNSKTNNVFIFNKQNGKVQKFCNLPQALATMTIRFVTFSNTNEFVICTIKMVDFAPQSLVFYKFKITI